MSIRPLQGPTYAVTLCATLVACSSDAKREELPSRLVSGAPLYDVLPRDAIPAVDEPVHVDALTAEAFLDSDEPVLGFVGPDGTAVAYSTWQLEEHEIVNDVIDGRPVAVTW